MSWRWLRVSRWPGGFVVAVRSQTFPPWAAAAACRYTESFPPASWLTGGQRPSVVCKHKTGRRRDLQAEKLTFVASVTKANRGCDQVYLKISETPHWLTCTGSRWESLVSVHFCQAAVGSNSFSQQTGWFQSALQRAKAETVFSCELRCDVETSELIRLRVEGLW